MTTLKYATTFINSQYKHIVEFGVAKGDSLRLLRESFPSNFKVFGFDSFFGLPEDWVGNPLCKKGCFSTNGEVPDIKDVTIFKGLFKDTICDYLKIAEPIALLHIDCDLYSSTKTVFKGIHKYIKPGTIIVFDEWCYNYDPTCNDHEQKAFYEYVKKNKVNFEFIDFIDQQNLLERKIVRIL